MRLTERAIAKLGLEPGQKDRLVFDDVQRGLGVRIGATGSTRYVVQYRFHGAIRRVPLGATNAISLYQARAVAAETMGAVAAGRDPFGERKKAAEADRKEREKDRLTLRALVEQWHRLHLTEKRPRYATEAVRALAYAFQGAWKRPAEALDRETVVRVLDMLPTAMAARTAAYGRACYGWAVKRGTLVVNPFRDLPSVTTEARSRVLSDEELAAVWRATDTEPAPFGPLVKTLILTGQRREEVAGMRWDELDDGLSTWTIPAARTKNGAANVVPLSEPSRAIVAAMPRVSSFVFGGANGRAFNGWSKRKRSLDDTAKLDAPWRLHDLRRSLATALQRLGVRLEVTESVLNHRSGSRSGIVAVYQKYDWQTEKRAALDAWAAHVLAVVEGREPETNVTEMQRA